MRIITKFKDYYDCGMKYGVEPSIVYVREQKFVPNTLEFLPCFKYLKVEYFTQYFIGFCGKIYLLFVYEKELGNKTFCYTSQHVHEIIQKEYSKGFVKNYFSKKDSFGYSLKMSSVDKLFEKTKKVSDSDICREFFIKHKCPVFKIYVPNFRPLPDIELNCNLKHVEFFRMFHPVSAFQEISMFMGNIAIPQKPMPEISNDMKIQAHGFDKHSFRKQ